MITGDDGRCIACGYEAPWWPASEKVQQFFSMDRAYRAPAYGEES